MSPSLSLRHYKSKAVAINDADPDDGNDWRCDACLLPIFSTPFVNIPDGLRMHDQCANKIPERFEDHPFHPGGSLVRQNLRGIDRGGKHCFRCKSKCGAVFYVCPDDWLCEGFTLDLPCALEIKIVHQSHGHELTATRGGSSSCSFICSACGTRHDPLERGKWGVSYVCSPCDFWLHPDCAVLPNAIEVDDDDDKAVVHHDHPLLLSYENYRADELWRLLRIRTLDVFRSDYKCAICGGGGGDDSKGLGWYRCFHCDYSVHIKCIVYSHPPQRFKPVLLRDAKTIEFSMSPRLSLGHFKSKALAINDADPDDGNDWRCDACLLPIFSTPFVVNQPDGGRMHDQCANKIPERFENHPLHSERINLVRQNLRGIDIENYCSRCKSKCGAMFYVCPDTWYCCGFTLDLACALAITIVHQSHKHELTATRGHSSCSFICSACGTQHHDRPELGEWGLSYVCSPCDFWIHPDCAALPNAIEFDDKVVHKHPLLLSYGNRADELWRFLRICIWDAGQSDYKCAICGGGGDDYKGLGWYRCFHCDYSIHIKCIVYSHPQRFKPVLLRDAKFPGLIHLPMANQHQSVIQRIMNSTAGTIDCASSSSSSYNSKVHQHPLVINHRNDDDDDDDDGARVCNACVQLISPSDAFYSCSSKVNNNNNSCRDFFLHSCCAQLPDEITTRRCSLAWKDDHSLSLLVEAVGNKFPFLRSVMGGKLRYDERNLHNGFAYLCKEYCDKYIDVIKALMPTSITHDAHAKSHILCITYQSRPGLTCSCCKRRNPGYTRQIGYECNNCNNFFIHMDCALLPDKVSHDFDRHPLNLITTSTSFRDHHQEEEEEEEEEELPLCEICEQDMDTGPWFYGCKKCNQSFHVDCMPYFDYLSKIKFGFTIRVTGHDCPLACVRALSVQGYRCAHCHHVIRESDEIAFECAECDYMIHEGCAEELLLKA